MKLRDAHLIALYPDGRVLVAWGDHAFQRDLRVVPGWQWRLARLAALLTGKVDA